MYTQQPLSDEFKKAAGDYAALYTSKVEVSYSPYYYINHPYWDTDEFQEGAVCYDGSLYTDMQELSLSVVRKDCVLPAFPTFGYSLKADNASDNHLIAEYEGHIVVGRLIGASADSVDVRLSCVGKDIRIFDGQSQPDGTYAFYTSGITDMQEIVLSALPEYCPQNFRNFVWHIMRMHSGTIA